MAEKQAAGTFVFESAEGETPRLEGREAGGSPKSGPAASSPVGSILYKEHLKLTDKSHVAEFAGYLMPLWYSSIGEEHSAVRKRAGVFDCTHMGAMRSRAKRGKLSQRGYDQQRPGSAGGSAQYSYILDAAGNILDDIIIYRRGEERFMVVVNASNEPKIKVYLAALQAGKAAIDLEKPNRRIKTGLRSVI